MQTEIAYFALGCFWSKEYFYSKLAGVVKTEVGFMGGHTDRPTYREVCTKKTGHAETVKVVFDGERVSYEYLVKTFFNLHDPTIDRSGKGGQYRSAIFWTTLSQEAIAGRLISGLEARGLTIYTQLEPAGPFWPAGQRHQAYCAVRNIVPRKRSESLFPGIGEHSPTG